MKRFLALAFAALLLAPPALAQECSTPEADRAEILAQHNKATDYELTGMKAQMFAQRTGAPEHIVLGITHIFMWQLPDGQSYLVAFYVAGCRGGSFQLPNGQVEMFVPASFRIRGA